MADQGNFKNLTVTWYDQSDAYATSSEIVDDVISLPQFTDKGSGEVNQATIVLSGNFGNFITDNGDKTVIDQYDRFRIKLDDLDGNTYDHFFEFKPLIIPSQIKTEGTHLTLDLLGIEYALQNIHFNRAFWFSNGFDVAQAIGVNYNDNRGTEQPVLTGHTTGYNPATGVGNDFPKFTVNHYEYGLHEDYVYNRWMDMADKFGGSVARGGILDFFEVSVETSAVNAIEVGLFPSGDRSRDRTDDANHVTIKQTDSINVGEQEGGIAAATGTIVAAWGAAKAGSLPVGRSIYFSGIAQFQYRPLWDSAIVYLTQARVEYQGKHYRKLTDTGTDTPPTNWTQVDMGAEFGDATQYSAWTDNKIIAWKNCGTDAGGVTSTNPAGSPRVYTGSGAGCFDSNLVINDNRDGEEFFRTWVHFQANTTAEETTAANNFAYSGASNQFPVATRCLVLGTGTGTFAGVDSNNIAFTNNIVEWTGTEWLVKYKPATLTDDGLRDMQVVVKDEGTLYVWDNAGGGTWVEISGDLAFDCIHTWDTMEEVASFDRKPAETDSTNYPEVTISGGTFATNINSGLQTTWTLTSDLGLGRLVGGSDSKTGAYYKKGAWLNLEFPLSPQNRGTSPATSVGDIYGTDTPAVGSLENSVFTTQNMDYNSRGVQGYNNSNSEDLGTIQSMAFVMRIGNKLLNGTTPRDGAINVRCCMFDIADNVVMQDFVVPFEGVWYPVDLPISGFTNYRSHKPRYLELSGNSIASLIRPKELDVQNVFEFRNIKLISWQVQDFYDEFGRYAPEVIGAETSFPIDNVSLAKFTGGKFTMAIDDFHWKKPLLAITAPDSTRNLEPEFLQRTHIMTYDQLKNDGETELEKQKFQLKMFDFRTSGQSIFDIKFGDTFFLENEELVEDEDDTTVGETTKKKIKLVAKNIEYSLTSPSHGVGGLSRRIQGTKRFV